MKNPQAMIATVAERYLGVREVTRNRSPEIDAFWKFTNYQEGAENREPWCCAAVVAWIQIADVDSAEYNLTQPPKTASVAEFLRWARDPKHGCQVFTPKADAVEQPRRGDIVIYLPQLSHIGVIAEDYDGNGHIETIEGNTNEAGSREGDGVYRKQRSYYYAGYFVRLPIIPKTK